MFGNYHGSCENVKAMMPQGLSTRHFLTWEAKPIPQYTAAASLSVALTGEHVDRSSPAHAMLCQSVMGSSPASNPKLTHDLSSCVFSEESAGNLWAAFKTWIPGPGSLPVSTGRGCKALGFKSQLV